MKFFKLILFFACLLILTCKENVEKNLTEVETEIISTTPSLEGAWELIGYYNYEDDKV